MQNYFFVDESGDPTFFNKKGELIAGHDSCSHILIIGFIQTSNPTKIRQEIAKLHQEIKDDDYLKSIPLPSKKCDILNF